MPPAGADVTIALCDFGDGDSTQLVYIGVAVAAIKQRARRLWSAQTLLCTSRAGRPGRCYLAYRIRAVLSLIIKKQRPQRAVG